MHSGLAWCQPLAGLFPQGGCSMNMQRAIRTLPRLRAKRRGFTLIELLIVIGIIGVIMGLLLPALAQARKAAARLECQNNMREMGKALANHLDRTGTYPDAGEGTLYWNWNTGAYDYDVLD